jgi:hypothetical protein
MKDKLYWIIVGFLIGVLTCMAIGSHIPWLFVEGI